VGSLGAAEAVLLSECGADVLQALRPHYSALVSVADIAAGNPHLRAFLRFVGELQKRYEAAEDAAQHWHARCSVAEAQLQQARAELEALRNCVAQEQGRANDLQAQLAARLRVHEEMSAEARMVENRMGAELERCRGEVLRLGAQGMAQGQKLASGQAALLACNHEISRLRVELEVTGTMSRQQASALEVARRQAAGADLSAEQASQERVKAEAKLRHATNAQRAELLSATESATAEAARLRQRIEGNRGELQGVRKVLAAQEALWSEVQSIAPCLAAAAEFLRDPQSPAAQLVQGPAPLAPGGPAPVRIPVAALRWGPSLALDTTPGWAALRDGIYGLFHRLQAGSLLPEHLELTVCCAAGRWFCTREEECGRFAALLMYQALHRDAPVAATCRVGTAHALLGLTGAELASFTGLGVRCAGALWRTPPLDDEEFLRAVLRGAPLREAFEDFLYQQRRGRVEEALREEARRDPVGSVASAQGPLRAPAMQPAVPAQGRRRSVI